MKTIILNVTFLLFGACLLAQNTWTVDNRPGTIAQFNSLQAAHDASQPGDFIYIHPSPYTYGVLDIRKEIHLRGIGHRPELANGEHAFVQTITFVFNTPSSNSSISGLNIGNIQDQGFTFNSNILIQNNRIGWINLSQAYNFVIEGNVFFNTNIFRSIRFSDNVHGNNLISHNIFNIVSNTNESFAVIANLVASDTVANNLFVLDYNTTIDNSFFSNCNNPIVNNNMFVLGPNAITSSINTQNSTINFQNCLTFAYGGQTISPINGSNNLDNINPQFIDLGNPVNPIFKHTNNYKLLPGSPAIGTGTDSSDLGIYGQGFLFQMNGYPFDLPYPTDIDINNVIVEAGGNLEVLFKAKANVEN